MITTEPNPYTGGQRVIAIGTPGNPATLTQQQLNQFALNYGKDLRSSHFERFMADGLDLSGWDLRDCTFLDGTIANSNMLTAQTTYAYSRRMVFPNTVMPLDTSSLNHDFVRAIIRAKALQVTGKSKTLLEWTASFIDPLSSDAARLSRDAYVNSWEPAIKNLREVQGYTLKQIRDFWALAFAAYPKLAARLSSMTAQTVWSGIAYQFPVWAEAAAVRAQMTNPNDRLEAQLLLDGDLNIVNPRHYVLMWEPQPCLLTTPLPGPWGWWELDL